MITAVIVALLCIVGGAILGCAIGYGLAESTLEPELEVTRARLAEANADRDRWKRLANKLHDETETQRAFLTPIFRIRGN